MSKPRDAREKAGLSIEEAAKFLGISGGYLSQIEHNDRTVDEQRALKMAKLYNCDLSDIFLPKRYASREVDDKEKEVI
jgi:transcriptional regulator with XRE-family HTH domain